MRQSFASALALTLLASLPATAQTAMSQSTQDLVTATGEGVVKRAPDQAFVTVASEARSREPREAQAQNARVATAIRDRLAAFTLPADAVRTLSVDVQPQFDWANGKQTLREYLATNVIEIRLDDVARVGEVVDAVVAAGATRVTGVRFTLKDSSLARSRRRSRWLRAPHSRGREPWPPAWAAPSIAWCGWRRSAATPSVLRVRWR